MLNGESPLVRVFLPVLVIGGQLGEMVGEPPDCILQLAPPALFSAAMLPGIYARHIPCGALCEKLAVENEGIRPLVCEERLGGFGLFAEDPNPEVTTRIFIQDCVTTRFR